MPHYDSERGTFLYLSNQIFETRIFRVTLLINRSDVQRLLPMSKAIDVLEAAFVELDAGSAEMPDRTVIVDPTVRGWIAYMPAYLKSGGALGVKAVTVYKGNPEQFGLPTTIGTILVQDKQTGVVVAVMDGGLLTGIRTGAASGVATRHLARKDSKVAGVLGTGVMARGQILALIEAADLDKISVYSRSDKSAQHVSLMNFQRSLE